MYGKYIHMWKKKLFVIIKVFFVLLTEDFIWSTQTSCNMGRSLKSSRNFACLFLNQVGWTFYYFSVTISLNLHDRGNLPNSNFIHMLSLQRGGVKMVIKSNVQWSVQNTRSSSFLKFMEFCRDRLNVFKIPKCSH